MKCSIIIPYAYSHESAIRLFHSLENQDFSKSDYELIFVNYGRKDSLDEYFARQSERLRVRYVPLYGSTVGEAKNLGVRKALGELVIFINGSEIASGSFVSEHYNSYKQYGRSVMQFGINKLVFEDCKEVYNENAKIFGNDIRYWLTEPEKYGLDKNKSYYYIKDIRLKMLEIYHYDFDKVHYKMLFTQTSNLSVPMECIRRFGGIDETLHVQETEDWEFGYRMMKNGVEIVYNAHAAVLRPYKTELFDSRRCIEWRKDLDIMLKKYNDCFLDELNKFVSFFDPVRRSDLKNSGTSRDIWLDVYKQLEHSAGTGSLAEAI